MNAYLASLLRHLNADPRTLTDLGALYHEYSIFGYASHQIEGMFPLNQRCKSPIISAYIQWAIAKSRKHPDDEVSFAELFCADGYYAMLASHFGVTSSIGIDNDRDKYLDVARKIAKRMKIANIRFVKDDVNRIDSMDKVDIVANVGGLYHVENPVEILAKSYSMARRYLIVQSVVSMANTDPDYFESPAPGWTWGSRFSRESFDNMIARMGYKIVDRHFNELEGNTKLEERGSVYYLIEVQSDSTESHV